MLRTVEGVYRNGKIELTEIPEGVDEDTTVIVTFVPKKRFDLASIGMTSAEAIRLRWGFQCFEDWDDPQMDIYNDYPPT